MQLGFVTAILAELSLEEVFAFAAEEGFSCVEVMCWPPGKAERRYAGVTHIDVTSLDAEAVSKIKGLVAKYGVSISSLGYYPNYLDPDAEQRKTVVEHFKKVIAAAPKLGVGTVTTFVGRDPAKSVEDNWPLFVEIFREFLQLAETAQVNIGIENCPMLFSLDEWPGGKNLAFSPAIWRKMFTDLPSPRFGLNFDPSHLLWLHIDYVRAIKEFGSRIHHVHAKDTKIDPDRLYEEGVMGLGWNTPKIPGYGDVDWGRYFSALTDVGYDGPVCIEVEDRAFEKSLDDRKRSLRQSKRFLEGFVS
jgi:sugar phosphate isomerase/epimerase